jgi:hypothetical protein
MSAIGEERIRKLTACAERSATTLLECPAAGFAAVHRRIDVADIEVMKPSRDRVLKIEGGRLIVS